MKKLVFYFGMGKNGSSSIRENFNNLERSGFKHYVASSDCVLMDFIERNVVAAPYYRRKNVSITDIYDMLDKSNSIISNTKLGGTYYNNFFQNVNPVLNINKYFSEYNPKILFIYRRQDDFLESQYKELVTMGYMGTIKDYTNFKDGKFGSYEGKMKLNVDVRVLNYYEYIMFLHDVFGRENVLALPYELMIEDYKRFIREVNFFVGVDEEIKEVIYKNKGFERNELEVFSFIRKNINRFGLDSFFKIFVKKQSHVKKIIRMLKIVVPSYKNNRFLDEEMCEQILQIHKEGNKRLSSMYENVDLKKYKYF